MKTTIISLRKRLAGKAAWAFLAFMGVAQQGMAQDVTVSEFDGEHIYQIKNGQTVKFDGVDNSYWRVPEYVEFQNGNTFKWIGRDGSYTFYKYPKPDGVALKNDRKTDRGANYLEIIPLNNGIEQIRNATSGNMATDAHNTDKNYWEYTGGDRYWNVYLQEGDRTGIYNSDAGTGTIWIGSGAGFGFPKYGYGLRGWNHGNGESHFIGDNTTAMAHPSDHKWYFDIKMGEQYQARDFYENRNTFGFMIKFFHRMNYETWASGAWHNDNEFDGPSSEKTYTINFRNKSIVDYLEISDGGNVQARRDVEYSEMPNLPEWYTFRFQINLDDLTGGYTYKNAPLDVEMLQRPEESKNEIKWSSNLFYLGDKDFNSYHLTHNRIAREANGTIPEDEDPVNVYAQLNNEPGTAGSKRIYLRDALRFDQCILYDDQNSNNMFYNMLTIEGELNDADMTFLGQLVKDGRISILDLSKAKIPGNRIPDEWAKKSEYLSTIYFPSTLTQIGESAFEESVDLTFMHFGDNTNCELNTAAFKNCHSLGNITFGNNTNFFLAGTSVFQGCSALPGDLYIEDGNDRLLVDRILEHIAGDGVVKASTFADCSISKVTIPQNITALNSQAFANCSSLHYVTVPNTETSKGGSVAVETLPVDASTYGEKFKVKDIVIPSDIIYAKDFNKTAGKGYSFATSGKSINWDGRANKYNEYREEAIDKVWIEGAGNLGWIRDGDWFNYTFYCEKSGTYNVTTTYAGEKSGTFNLTFDGNTTITSNVTNSGWSTINTTSSNTNIELKKGWHVVKADEMGNMNLYQFKFNLQSETTDETKTTTVASGNVVTCADDAFKGVYSNQCEVVFTGEDDSDKGNYNYYKEYRQSTGWMYLLTKSIYELSDAADESLTDITAVDIDGKGDNPTYEKTFHSAHVSGQHDYDLCHQKHADVKLFRKFSAGNIWDTMVLPFDVYAGTDANNNAETTIRTKEGNIQYAAIYARCTGDHIDLLNVGGHNTKDATYGAADYKLEAGTPFFVKLGTKASDDVYTFVNVETMAAEKQVTNVTTDDEKLKEVTSVTKGDYTLAGTYNAIQTVWDEEKNENVLWNVESMGGVWAMSNGKLVHAKKTAKFKGYRCWFQAAEGVGAKEMTTLNFDAVDEDVTAIQAVEGGSADELSGEIYDLSGRRVSRPTRGIYIQNGKKMIIK